MRQLKMFVPAFLLALAPLCVHAQGQGSGILYASDFNAWSLPQGNTPTAGMIQWPSAAICQISSNGYTFTAVKIGRPLTIVDVVPSQTETVIPVAVTTSGGSCTVTAPMVHVHTSYSVRSGTAGLQEAIDYSAKIVGGSLVVLTPGWTAAGGVTGMITSAYGQTATSILDERVATLCQYAFNGSTYAAAGCSTDAASLTELSLQTFAGPLAVPQGITAPITGTVTGHSTLDLPLTGGTLTGALNGTSASFSGAVSGATLTGGSASLSGSVSAGTTLTVGTTLTSPVINSTYFPTTFTQLQSNVTACASLTCTIVVNATLAVTANYAIPSFVVLQVNNGAQLQPDTGHTLTVNGPIQAGPVQIFGGAGSVVLGATTSKAPVEWFGAVGDWNGTTGTTNNTAMQACLNALTGGQCVLQAKGYKITASLTISKSNVGILGTTGTLYNSAIFPAPSPSQIVTTSSTADVITAAGASTAAEIVNNHFEYFTMTRTTAPGTDAAGIRLSYSSAAVIDGVTGQDHTACFYFHAVGSLGYGKVTNSACQWGYNGFLETTGQLAGFEVDSLDGNPSPSLRIENSFVASNTPQNAAVTTYGFQAIGLAVNDLHVTHLETAQVSYGEFIHATGGSFGQSSDIFINEPINDGCLVSCIYIQGIRGSVNVQPAWKFEATNTANGPVIDIEDSVNVSVDHMKVYYPATGQPGIKAVNSGNLHITNNFILGNAVAISLATTSGSVLSGNIMNGPNNWGTNVIELKTNSQGNVISSNSIQGTATNGIFIDPTSGSVAGLDTNQIGSISSLGTITNFINDASQLGASTPESLVVGNANIPGSGGVQFPLLAGGGPECLEMDSTGHVTGTGVPCGSGSGVTSIDTQTGAFTFSGAGVSHVGNAYTFSGAGSGVTSINSTAGAFTFTGSGVSCTSTTCTFSGGAFSSLTGGTNTTAAMVVGSGGSLSFSGTGTINANLIAGGTAFTGNQGNGAKVQHSTGTTASGDCAEFDANGNVVDAGSGCGTSGVAPVSVTVPSFAIPTNTCYGSAGSTTPATFTMTGITTAMGITPDFTSNPASVVGWGASGGLGIKVYSSATNTGSYVICNPTSGTITGDSITFLMSSSSGGSSGGSGSVSIVSSGNLSPLFTTSVSNATTTPAISYTLSNAAQNAVLSGPTSGSGVPSYRALVGGDLPAQYRIRNCSVGLGDGVNAIPAGTYPIKGQCRNLYGVTYTITGVQCFSDNSGTSTGNVADSAANALLTGSITATSSWANGTQSGTTTLGTNVWANWTIVADGASKQIQCTMTGTI